MDWMLVLQLVGIVGFNALSNCIGTLKTIFISSRNKKPAYIITFIDAVVFYTMLKQITSGDGVMFVIAYATGKLLGMMIAEAIEGKMALGLLEVDVWLNDEERMMSIAKCLQEEKGYAVNAFEALGYKGAKRFQMEVTLLRKELPVLEQVLKDFGYENPTCKVKDILNVRGKFTVGGTSHNEEPSSTQTKLTA